MSKPARLVPDCTLAWSTALNFAERVAMGDAPTDQQSKSNPRNTAVTGSPNRLRMLAQEPRLTSDGKGRFTTIGCAVVKMGRQERSYLQALP